eukprot:GFYU01006774.1.p1 GENE.GFYU01006774.1~~GFYU01006774.1.p1  ORF type:complete len:289 (-),score=60.07 GFYU01006774.1:392-1258(-)
MTDQLDAEAEWANPFANRSWADMVEEDEAEGRSLGPLYWADDDEDDEDEKEWQRTASRQIPVRGDMSTAGTSSHFYKQAASRRRSLSPDNRKPWQRPEANNSNYRSGPRRDNSPAGDKKKQGGRGRGDGFGDKPGDRRSGGRGRGGKSGTDSKQNSFGSNSGGPSSEKKKSNTERFFAEQESRPSRGSQVDDNYVPPSPGVNALNLETDEHRLQQRLKQINIGKNTPEYEHYLKLVPKDKRTPNDPFTPDVRQKMSKRCWDGQVRRWRRELHKYDPVPEGQTDALKGL